jgi:hypothetical protein
LAIELYRVIFPSNGKGRFKYFGLAIVPLAELSDVDPGTAQYHPCYVRTAAAVLRLTLIKVIQKGQDSADSTNGQSTDTASFGIPEGRRREREKERRKKRHQGYRNRVQKSLDQQTPHNDFREETYSRSGEASETGGDDQEEGQEGKEEGKRRSSVGTLEDPISRSRRGMVKKRAESRRRWKSEATKRNYRIEEVEEGEENIYDSLELDLTESMSSTSPTSPASPASPGSPLSPGSPASPESPLSPESPASPGSPLSPGSPASPSGPEDQDLYSEDFDDPEDPEDPEDRGDPLRRFPSGTSSDCDAQKRGIILELELRYWSGRQYYKNLQTEEYYTEESEG